jgi:hypothetical protein
MPANRVFRVVWMKPGQTGTLETTEVRFDGSEIILREPRR